MTSAPTPVTPSAGDARESDAQLLEMCASIVEFVRDLRIDNTADPIFELSEAEAEGNVFVVMKAYLAAHERRAVTPAHNPSRSASAGNADAQASAGGLSAKELDAIEARARVATEGPWRMTFAKGQIHDLPEAFIETIDDDQICRFEDYGNDEDNAAHIADLDPQTVLRLVAQARLALGQTQRIELFENVLRGIAFYLGVGGYNALEVDPDLFDRKIRDGIDMFVAPWIKDAERYRRLRTRGVAPGGTRHLEERLILVASNLDVWIDALLKDGLGIAPSNAAEGIEKSPAAPPRASEADVERWCQECGERHSEDVSCRSPEAIMDDLRKDEDMATAKRDAWIAGRDAAAQAVRDNDAWPDTTVNYINSLTPPVEAQGGSDE